MNDYKFTDSQNLRSEMEVFPELSFDVIADGAETAHSFGRPPRRRASQTTALPWLHQQHGNGSAGSSKAPQSKPAPRLDSSTQSFVNGWFAFRSFGMSLAVRVALGFFRSSGRLCGPQVVHAPSCHVCFSLHASISGVDRNWKCDSMGSHPEARSRTRGLFRAILGHVTRQIRLVFVRVVFSRARVSFMSTYFAKSFCPRYGKAGYRVIINHMPYCFIFNRFLTPLCRGGSRKLVKRGPSAGRREPLGGSGGMPPREILKSRASKTAISCISRRLAGVSQAEWVDHKYRAFEGKFIIQVHCKFGAASNAYAWKV